MASLSAEWLLDLLLWGQRFSRHSAPCRGSRPNKDGKGMHYRLASDSMTLGSARFHQHLRYQAWSGYDNPQGRITHLSPGLPQMAYTPDISSIVISTDLTPSLTVSLCTRADSEWVTNLPRLSAGRWARMLWTTLILVSTWQGLFGSEFRI